ncbi:hypothetical protein NUACC21_04260 [Scytonema sp. NUACC21]
MQNTKKSHNKDSKRKISWLDVLVVVFTIISTIAKLIGLGFQILEYNMTRISAEKIEKLIAEAEQAGVSDEELQELREHLAEIKSGKMAEQIETEPMYQEFIRDGKRVVRVSTGPMSSKDDILLGFTFEPVKRP